MTPGNFRIVKRYTRADLQSNPGTLYVFGDNMARYGMGGQAKECRGEPNAVGIPTKWRPANDDAAFFCDADLPKVKPDIQRAFRRLQFHLLGGGDVVWPTDGIGTGLSRLYERAPLIARYLEACQRHLMMSTAP